jgi:SHS2 domain-containing protein
MLRYREVEHTADVGVEIYGDTLEALFQNAGYALCDTIVAAQTVAPTVTRTITAAGSDVEGLLMNWLRELLYRFAVYQEVYTEFDIQTLRPTRITARVSGEALDPEKHQFRTEIKAVTYHQFSVTRHNSGWTARILFDV